MSSIQLRAIRVITIEIAVIAALWLVGRVFGG
jgi:hypothetical protein